MGCTTGFPITNGLLRNDGMSGTRWLLIFTYSAAQLMMANMSTAALSAPGSKEAHGLNLRLVFLREYFV